MSQFFKGVLKHFLPVVHIFTRTDNLWPWKSATGRNLHLSCNVGEWPPFFWLDSNGKPAEQYHLKLLYQFIVSVEAYPYAYPEANPLTTQPNSVLTCFRFNIENYFCNSQVCLTRPTWMDWMKQVYLGIPNHMQKMMIITKFILSNFIPKIIPTHCFASFWKCLTTPTWNEWVNLLLLVISNHT